jgi:hypothetical protein
MTTRPYPRYSSVLYAMHYYRNKRISDFRAGVQKGGPDCTSHYTSDSAHEYQQQQHQHQQHQQQQQQQQQGNEGADAKDSFMSLDVLVTESEGPISRGPPILFVAVVAAGGGLVEGPRSGGGRNLEGVTLGAAGFEKLHAVRPGGGDIKSGGIWEMLAVSAWSG